MRNMSFTLTTEQVRTRTKTVTRRIGWTTLQPGTLLQPVVKGQGIPKGGTVEKIGGPIRVVSVEREPLRELHDYCGAAGNEVTREGFPNLTTEEFIAMFCEHNRCRETDEVTRIEFTYERVPVQ